MELTSEQVKLVNKVLQWLDYHGLPDSMYEDRFTIKSIKETMLEENTKILEAEKIIEAEKLGG